MDIINVALQYFTQGGSAAIIAFLVIAVAVLIWDRKKLANDLTSTTERVYDAKDHESEMLREIIDKYHKGNIDLIHALNEIKIVLVTIEKTRH